MNSIILTEDVILFTHKNNKRLSNYKIEYLMSFLKEDIDKTIIKYRGNSFVNAVINFIFKKLPKTTPDIGQGYIFYKERGWSDEEIYLKNKNKIKTKRLSAFNYKTYMIKYQMDEETARYEANKRRPIKKEYWLEKGFSEEESLKMAILTKNKNNSNGKSKSKPKYSSKLCIEYYIIRGFSEEEAKKIISNIQRTFTYEKCIKKYGQEEGIKIFNQRQEKWQNTLNNKTKEEKDITNSKKNIFDFDIFSKKYKGNDPEQAFRDYFYEKTHYYIPQTLEEYINDIIENYKVDDNLLNVSRKTLNSKIYQSVLSLFKTTKEYIISVIEKQYSFVTDNDYKQKSKFGTWNRKTEFGFLRSSLEISFYELLLKNNFAAGKDFLIEENYPNSNLKSDFYFPKSKKHVEICGSTTGEYYQRMLFKQETFGAHLLKNYKEFNNFIKDLNESNN